MMMWTSVLLCIAAFSAVQAETMRDKRQAAVNSVDVDRPCSNPNNESGTCINIRQCAELMAILQNQRTQPGKAQFLRDSLCGYQGKDPEVCCPTRVSTNSPVVVPITASSARSSLKVTTLPVPPDQCGYSTAAPRFIYDGRIVGGKPAALGNWPWLAALGYTPRASSVNKDTLYLCGGSLITQQHVLTAGHCVHNRKDLVLVRLGDLDLQSDDDGAKPINVRISKKKVHENYSSKTYINDIAILTLQTKVPYSNAIHPICLPFTQEISSRSLVGRSPFIAGWGSTSFRGAASSKLLELQIPVVENSDCQRAYRTFTNTIIDDKIICAGYARGGKDSCQGDSGGPLMDPVGPTTFYLVGVVSFGFKCAEPGYPGVYTRITSFLDWIQMNTV